MFPTLLLLLPILAVPDQRVTFEVGDARDGTPLACRVYVEAEDGKWYFPEPGEAGGVIPYRRQVNGRPKSVEMHATVSASPFVVKLPPGKYKATIERGKEYHQWVESFEVGGEPLTLRPRLRRWIDASERGWYSGDTHAHRALDEIPNLLLAEDLNITFPMTDWVREAFVPPMQRRPAGFKAPGKPVIEVAAKHLIVTSNTEYELFTVGGKPHTLGAFFVLGHRAPLEMGAPPVAPVGKLAHDQGALIDLDKHNWAWSMAVIPIMPVDLFELANNHVWRTEFAFGGWAEKPSPEMGIETNADGLTEKGWIEFGFKNYYALLNCGFRLRPTAGTGSGVHPVPLGFGRVYVHVDGALTAEKWISALNEGNGFVTTGPLMFVKLNDRLPGRAPHASDGRSPLRLQGTLESAGPLSRIEIVKNGEVVATIKPLNEKTDRGGFVTRVDQSLLTDASAWIAVRCFEPIDGGRERFAHSAPYYIDVPGRPIRPRKFEVDYLVDRVKTQIERSKDVLPKSAIDEYRKALSIYESLRESAR